MSISWRQALAFGLAASLLASPALARDRHERAWRERGHHARMHRPAYPAHAHPHPHRHRGGDAGELALVLGVAAVGLTAFALWAAAQPPPPPRTPPPPPGTIDWNAIDPGVGVISEGYLDTGEYCREFEREIWIGDRAEWAVGLACEMPDGSWRIVR